ASSSALSADFWYRSHMRTFCSAAARGSVLSTESMELPSALRVSVVICCAAKARAPIVSARKQETSELTAKERRERKEVFSARNRWNRRCVCWLKKPAPKGRTSADSFPSLHCTQ